MLYDDEEVGFEDLQHKKHKLPDLAGDEVFNPDADAVSSSDSDDKPLAGQATTTLSDGDHDLLFDQLDCVDCIS